MNETIEQKCIAKGVKLTDQRKIIAKVMSESNDHPDVDELYNRVSKIDSKPPCPPPKISPNMLMSSFACSILLIKSIFSRKNL